MELKIEEMIIRAKNKISAALEQTEYSSYIGEIVEDYVVFIKVCIEKGLINNVSELELFKIDYVEYFEGNAYASWLWHKLTLQNDFLWKERKKKEGMFYFMN